MQIVTVASNNAKKIREIEQILATISAGVTTRTARDIGLAEPVEDGETFRDNAIIKARAAFDLVGGICLADDSGLSVDALGGAPGVHSARFAGHDATDADNNDKLIASLAGLSPERRGARYHCTIALCMPVALATRLPPNAPTETLATAHGDAVVLTVDGWVAGRVIDTPAGSGGFGYDPYMLYPPAGVTFAELSAEAKHAISHRGQALRALAPYLEALLVV